MKKFTLTIILLSVFFNAISQEDEKITKNEIKLNVAYLVKPQKALFWFNLDHIYN